MPQIDVLVQPATVLISSLDAGSRRVHDLSVRAEGTMRNVCLATYIIASGLVFLAGPSAANAQGTDPPRPHPGATADFMFGRPHGSLSLRGSWVFARAGSDLFDFVTDQLTLESGDFNARAIGGELGIVLTPRLEALAGVEMSTTSERPSEYRRFIDNSGQPIEQETKLKTVSLTGSVKFALMPRGRSISRLAWIPRGLTPYMGAGGGATRYEFLQRGDFVDFVDLSVFTDVFQSKGWSPSAHAFGGVDLQVYRRLFVQFEGRYTWARGTLTRDFVDFDPIDLAGFRTTAGVSLLF
jgi:opacity protein-like surface antigen